MQEKALWQSNVQGPGKPQAKTAPMQLQSSGERGAPDGDVERAEEEACPDLGKSGEKVQS